MRSVILMIMAALGSFGMFVVTTVDPSYGSNYYAAAFGVSFSMTAVLLLVLTRIFGPGSTFDRSILIDHSNWRGVPAIFTFASWMWGSILVFRHIVPIMLPDVTNFEVTIMVTILVAIPGAATLVLWPDRRRDKRYRGSY